MRKTDADWGGWGSRERASEQRKNERGEESESLHGTGGNFIIRLQPAGRPAKKGKGESPANSAYVRAHSGGELAANAATDGRKKMERRDIKRELWGQYRPSPNERTLSSPADLKFQELCTYARPDNEKPSDDIHKYRGFLIFLKWSERGYSHISSDVRPQPAALCRPLVRKVGRDRVLARPGRSSSETVSGLATTATGGAGRGVTPFSFPLCTNYHLSGPPA